MEPASYHTALAGPDGGLSMRWVTPNRAERPECTGNDFKICNLCGALNPADTDECVICSWRGRFDIDSDAIAKAMKDLRDDTGWLNDAFVSEDVLLDEYLTVKSHRRGRLATWVRKLLGLDQEAYL
jgi:hypothetical protein